MYPPGHLKCLLRSLAHSLKKQNELLFKLILILFFQLMYAKLKVNSKKKIIEREKLVVIAN